RSVTCGCKTGESGGTTVNRTARAVSRIFFVTMAPPSIMNLLVTGAGTTYGNGWADILSESHAVT
ncbi:MAG: hypothetical protein ABEJ46_01345, partial [Gemmatimonadota bacterium]